jgi:hypothetical protein
MYSRATFRGSTVSLLLDWIFSLYSRRGLTRRSVHRANDIAAVAALTGNPPGV